MIVCHCAAVNDREIRALVNEGAGDLLAVASACGAGSFCGGCTALVASLLSEETGVPASTFLREAPTTPTAEQPLTVRKRAETVVREIQEDIAAAGWPVGEVFGAPAELADRYAVSPGTVREAVRLLVHHGLLQQDGERLVVGAPAPSTIGEAAAIYLHRVGVSLDEVVEVRRALEAVMVQRAARNDDRALRARQLGAAGTPDEDPLEQPARQHVEFHLALATLSGNPAFGLLVDALIRLARDLAPAEAEAIREERSRQIAAAHREIAEAVLAGDADEARRRLVTHLDAFYQSLTTQPGPRADVAARRRGHERERPAAALARVIAFDIRERGLGAGELVGAERDLALRYRASRSELRQAVSLLELYSVATPLAGPQGGVVVSPPDQWAVAQLMAQYLDFARIERAHIVEIRHALELRSVELASARIDAEAASRLIRRLEEELVARQRDPLHDRGHHNIHPLIAELSGNRVLMLFTSALVLALLRQIGDHVPERVRQARYEDVAAVHSGIVEAIVAGDSRLARERMQDHLRRHAHPGPPADSS